MNSIDLTLIKDIILIIGSLTATFFTLRSFNKWKKEHKGKLKYELSRNLLKSILDLRDDFGRVRSPLILASEFSSKHHISETKKSEQYQYVFQNRLKYLQESYNTFLSFLPEVEIDYNSEMSKLCKELTRHVTHYNIKLNEFIQLVDNLDTFNNPYEKELNSIIFNNGDNNPTTDSFDKTVGKLKIQLTKEMKKY
ncbi:hypothetical protein H2O64_03065 [Kordia sp. YSTF-M3]|uniref:LemA family protein n=1 Tax=Kordia aestuariivivens TaxID=2759037 RepID=A0ABR7Q538_9FLAO|nr:hypothetical protein [Kordia aestuariivivens]MBC8753637.1 hypothetical protein [Kordia aestuariivivens]